MHLSADACRCCAHTPSFRSKLAVQHVDPYNYPYQYRAVVVTVRRPLSTSSGNNNNIIVSRRTSARIGTWRATPIAKPADTGLFQPATEVKTAWCDSPPSSPIFVSELCGNRTVSCAQASVRQLHNPGLTDASATRSTQEFGATCSLGAGGGVDIPVA